MSGQKGLISSGDAIQLRKSFEKTKQKKEKTKSKKSKQPQLLHFAVQENQKDCCKVLLDQQMDVNEKEVKTGNTALHYAAENVRNYII